MHEYNSTHFRSSVVGQTKKSEVLMNTEWSELSIGMCRYIIGWRGRVERVGEVSNHPSSWRMRCSNSPSPSCISEEAPARANVDHGDAHAHIHARGRARPVGGRCCFDGMMMMRSREEIELPAAVRERRCRRRSRRQPDNRQTSGTSWHLAPGIQHPASGDIKEIEIQDHDHDEHDDRASDRGTVRDTLRIGVRKAAKGDSRDADAETGYQIHGTPGWHASNGTTARRTRRHVLLERPRALRVPLRRRGQHLLCLALRPWRNRQRPRTVRLRLRRRLRVHSRDRLHPRLRLRLAMRLRKRLRRVREPIRPAQRRREVRVASQLVRVRARDGGRRVRAMWAGQP